MFEFLTSLRLEKSPLCIYSTFCLSIQSSTGYFDFFQVPAFVNNAAMNTAVQITVWVPTFNSLKYQWVCENHLWQCFKLETLIKLPWHLVSTSLVANPRLFHVAYAFVCLEYIKRFLASGLLRLTWVFCAPSHSFSMLQQ